MRTFRVTAGHGVLLISLITLSLLGYEELRAYMGARDGNSDAIADLNSGILRLKWGGHAKPWRLNVIRLFRERYGVEIQYPYGCTNDAYDDHYASAYNKLMYREIKQKHPALSMDDVIEEARRQRYAEAAR